MQSPNESGHREIGHKKDRTFQEGKSREFGEPGLAGVLGDYNNTLEEMGFPRGTHRLNPFLGNFRPLLPRAKPISVNKHWKTDPNASICKTESGRHQLIVLSVFSQITKQPTPTPENREGTLYSVSFPPGSLKAPPVYSPPTPPPQRSEWLPQEVLEEAEGWTGKSATKITAL